MKVGTVALVGRPNTGKSTLINNLVGHKVAITSPKPQTTMRPTYAVYEDDLSTRNGEGRGQIVFVDTPGIFAKTPDARSKEVNMEAERIIKEDVDVLVYMVDPTRQRGLEENRVLGLVRKLEVPKILAFNKADIKDQKYLAQYKFLEDEFDKVVTISALKPMNLGALVDAIFEYLPEGEKIVNKEDLATPALNITSTMYVEELIREKIFLTLRKEVPYMVRVVVDNIEERKPQFNRAKGDELVDRRPLIYIKARIMTPERYKKMIIGAGGERIKQIGSMTRKELELSTGQHIYLDLQVEVER